MEDPMCFGRPRAEPVWIRRPGEEAHLAAAYLQHRVAQAVVTEFETSSHTHSLESLAEHVGESVDYVRSKLYGHAPISLEDLMQWAHLFGVHILPPMDPSSFDELLP